LKVKLHDHGGAWKPSFDYTQLKARIFEMYGTQEAFANALGMSLHTLSYRLNGRLYFTANEMAAIAELLKFPKDAKDNYRHRDFMRYFFTKKIQKVEPASRERRN
jgi:transcriptional regulator with XRE-family HTH domain